MMTRQVSTIHKRNDNECAVLPFIHPEAAVNEYPKSYMQYIYS